MSKDTNSCQVLRVLSLMKSANLQEFLTYYNVFFCKKEKFIVIMAAYFPTPIYTSSEKKAAN